MERRNNRIIRDNPKFHSSRIVIVLKVGKEGEKKRFSSEFFQDRTRIVKKKKKKECGARNKPSSLFIDNISVKKYI